MTKRQALLAFLAAIPVMLFGHQSQDNKQLYLEYKPIMDGQGFSALEFRFPERTNTAQPLMLRLLVDDKVEYEVSLDEALKILRG
jgi:hypothetical protein